MSTKEIKIEKIVCDICDKEMTQDEDFSFEIREALPKSNYPGAAE